MSARDAEPGFTLMELLVAIVLAGVVLASICETLAGNQRFYRSTSQILDVQQGIREVAQLLPNELRGLDPGAGDILAMGPDSITIKALRGSYFVCAKPSPATGTIIVRDDLAFAYRSVDASRDRALVFRDGGTPSADDDAWLDLAIVGSARSAGCSDGSGAGTALDLAGAIAGLDGVTTGSPVRTYERVTYRLYSDSPGIAWLGVRNHVSGAWSAISPVAGPLRPGNGLSLAYYDSTGAVTATAADVAQIRLVARGISPVPIAIPGRRDHGRRYQDSLAVRVALRNAS